MTNGATLMKTQAVPIWLSMVACLVVGNFAAGLAYWMTDPGGRGVEEERNEVRSTEQRNRDVTGEGKLAGDVLLLVLDTRYFREHGDEWVEQLTGIQGDIGTRLLGGSVQLVDRKMARAWNPTQPLLAGGDLLADEDVDGAFAQAFGAIEDFGRRTSRPTGFKTFVVWMTDVNPDLPPRTRPLVRPRSWVMLLWHGRPGPSRRLTELLGDDSIVRFKQDTTGLRNTIRFYVDRPGNQ
jgi:hypothetical protein